MEEGYEEYDRMTDWTVIDKNSKCLTSEKLTSKGSDHRDDTQ